MGEITLTSSDDQQFKVDENVAKKSFFVASLIEDVSWDPETTILLPNVTGSVLEKVVQWATHHRDDPPPPLEDHDTILRINDDVEVWDANFCKVNRDILFDLLLAANYMDIQPLLDLTSITTVSPFNSSSPLYLYAIKAYPHRISLL